MAVIDLSKRLTSNWLDYIENIKSHESYIFIEPLNSKIQSNTTINLTVGTEWYDSRKHMTINLPEKGISVKSGKYIVVVTEQMVGVPYNVYGIVVGKGDNIFSGGIVSTGKIVPGFKDKLKIGYYNAGKNTILLKKGDLLACCMFFNVEATLEGAEKEDEDEKFPVLRYRGKFARFIEYLSDNWYNVLSIILSIVAIIVAIIR